jgi:two-component system invasion response regulator UvrY
VGQRVKARKRLLLIEDHQMVGESFRNMLEPEFQVDGPHGDGRLVPALVRDTQPDMVLLDLELRHRNGADLIAELRRDAPDTFILVVTVETRPEVMEDVLNRGAHGFVPKGAGFEELRVAIEAVFAGQIYRSPHIQRIRYQRPVHPHDEAIRRFDETRRRVFELIGQGYTAEDIARHIGMTRWTVYYHRKVLRDLLRVRSNRGLELEARDWLNRQEAAEE